MPIEVAKGIKSVLSLHPVEEVDVGVPDYTDDEKEFIGRLQVRLTSSADNRNGVRDEFDGLDYINYWWAIENAANTTIRKMADRKEADFRSGTLRTKMFAFLNSFQALNLGSDITAYDENDTEVQRMGNAMEDVIFKTKELDNDEEKRPLRQHEMMKHGYVFVEKNWINKWEIEKIMTAGTVGQIKGMKWDTKKKKGGGMIETNIIAGPGVYLGSMRQYFIDKQPYIFTVETVDYSVAEKIYGEWERWKYVSKTKRQFSGTAGDEMIGNAWRLLDGSKKGKVEVIKYQDKPNNEFQIILNGVLMIPIGYPLSEVSPGGEYTITQQNLEPIRYNFALGKSFIFKNKNLVALMDTMLKLAVLKNWKSYQPPLINTSGRLISKNVLMPNTISQGIAKGELTPIYENVDQGVGAGEFNMINMTKDFINENTASQTFGGAKEEGGKVTATQILELQRQARLMMGLMVLASTLLEKKLDTKQLTIILEHWFEPVDEIVDEVRNMLVNKYRIVSTQKNIEGEGSGSRMVVPTDESFTNEDVRIMEDQAKDETGKPVRIMIINPRMLKEIQLTWVMTTTAKEKETSEYSKIIFGSMMQDAIALGLRLNIDYVEEEFAKTWEKDPAKMFAKGIMGMQEMEGQGMKGGPAAPQPKVEGPKIESLNSKPQPSK